MIIAIYRSDFTRGHGAGHGRRTTLESGDVLLSLNGLAVAFLGLFPDTVMMLCTTALLRSV